MQIDRPIAIAVMLLLAFLLVFFLVMPEYRAFRTLQADLAVKRAEYYAQRDYYAAVAKAYFELESKQEELKKVDDALPKDPDLGQLVYFLQRTAAKDGIMLKDLSLSKSGQSQPPGQQQNNTTIKDISFSMSLTGGYKALERFLISLQRSSRLFEVTRISFGSEALAVSAEQGQFQSQQAYAFSLEVKTHSY